jgi:peptidoglycan/LPS O-acetylase OafA/YrhL
MYNYHNSKTDGTQGLLIGLEDAPESLLVFMSNGWVSTSLFFLLSGFILAYLYWGEDDQFTTTKRRFWVLRFARIYPIHLIVLVILFFLKFPNYLDENLPLASLISSAVGTSVLFQAWVPAWIPLWSWPSWTISVMIFLYLLMPYLVDIMSRLSRRQQIMTLVLMPFVSIIPTAVYASMTTMGVSWSMNKELFFGNFPLFWVPYFVAGMLMTRIFSLNRFRAKQQTPAAFAWGDLASFSGNSHSLFTRHRAANSVFYSPRLTYATLHYICTRLGSRQRTDG